MGENSGQYLSPDGNLNTRILDVEHAFHAVATCSIFRGSNFSSGQREGTTCWQSPGKGAGPEVDPEVFKF